MSVLFSCLFVVVANVAIYALVVSLRDYSPRLIELLRGNPGMLDVPEGSYAVWPTRLRLCEEAITGVPHVLFRRRPKPFARKMTWRPAAKRVQRLTRQLRYAAAPERVFVIS